VLSDEKFTEFSLRYMQQIVSGLTREADGRTVPVTLFTKGGGRWLEAMAATGCDALGLDWTQDIGQARQRVGGKVALQGNMDPSVLYASADVIKSEAKKVIEGFGEGEGHVFNLGHGIHQHIDPEKVSVLVDSVHEYGRRG